MALFKLSSLLLAIGNNLCRRFLDGRNAAQVVLRKVRTPQGNVPRET